mmetsp:Transcript_23096/g.34779  ORF Transcript_23096/g.34779 Transcript_23096/m.34779 type:complete len:100 (+) Transcript_23096:118-417(+)
MRNPGCRVVKLALLLLLMLVPSNEARVKPWIRECGIACTSYHSFKDTLRAAKDACNKDKTCPAVVDFSGNGGLFAVCKPGTEYRKWNKVCVEKSRREEL